MALSDCSLMVHGCWDYGRSTRPFGEYCQPPAGDSAHSDYAAAGPVDCTLVLQNASYSQETCKKCFEMEQDTVALETVDFVRAADTCFHDSAGRQPPETSSCCFDVPYMTVDLVRPPSENSKCKHCNQ